MLASNAIHAERSLTSHDFRVILFRQCLKVENTKVVRAGNLGGLRKQLIACLLKATTTGTIPRDMRLAPSADDLCG